MTQLNSEGKTNVATTPKFEGFESVKKGVYYGVDPDLIDIPPDFNGRRFPVSDEAVDEMVASLLSKTQLQPISCRREGERLQVYAGITRLRAAKKIKLTQPDFIVKTFIDVNMNPTDAFLANIEENRVRNETSVVDDSYNIHRLLTQYNKTPDQVRELYGYNPNKFNEVRKVRGFSDLIQRRLHAGEINFSTALVLHGMDPAKADEALEKLEAKAKAEAEAEIQAEREAADGPADDAKPKKKGRKAKANKPAKMKKSRGKVKGTDAKEMARSGGAKIRRTASDLRKLIMDHGRIDDVPSAILRYISGDIDGDLLMAVFDMAENCIVEMKPVSPLPPVEVAAPKSKPEPKPKGKPGRKPKAPAEGSETAAAEETPVPVQDSPEFSEPAEVEMTGDASELSDEATQDAPQTFAVPVDEPEDDATDDDANGPDDDNLGDAEPVEMTAAASLDDI